MSSVFKTAIIGAGGIAGAHLAAAKATAGRVSIVGVVDPVEANRAKLAADAGAKGFASVEELLAVAKGLELSAAVVCTPPATRLKIIGALLEKGIAVLSEKPLAHTAEDARALADLARKHANVKTAVAYCHRFTPAVIEMNRLVEQGKIGRLTRFENVFACDLPGHQTKWMSDTPFSGGGAFIDMGCHSLDLYHFMVGRPKIRGAVFDHTWAGRAESGATVLVSAIAGARANINPGVAGVIESGWAETSRFTVALVGTQGMLFYDYEQPTHIVFKDLLGKATSMPIESHDVRFARQLAAFADWVQHGKPAALASFADGVIAAEAVDAATHSAKA